MIERPDIIRMAREAGLAPYHPALGLRDDQQVALERFAELVKADAVAAAHEACAQLCDAVAAGWERHHQVAPLAAEDCARRIRARGQSAAVAAAALEIAALPPEPEPAPITMGELGELAKRIEALRAGSAP